MPGVGPARASELPLRPLKGCRAFSLLFYMPAVTRLFLHLERVCKRPYREGERKERDEVKQSENDPCVEVAYLPGDPLPPVPRPPERALRGIVLFVLIKYTKTIDKRKCCIAAFIAVSITVSLLYLIPFENAFITFSTPEKAFHYTNSWDIDNIVSGTETSFVIASKNNVNTYKIVPKTQKGWKISSALATKDMFQYFYNGISIHIYRYKNSSDYYIALFDTDGGQINITDNRGSNFISVIQNQSADIEPVYHYYACINNMDSEYVITLNGEDIKLPITKYS